METKTDVFDLDRLGGHSALREVLDEVLAAGEHALSIFRRGLVAQEAKADRSPVTEADRAVEQRLRQFAARRFPDLGFVGEEAGGQSGSGLSFVVDPIDGTRAFLRGLPTWSILVGIEDRGEPVVGVAFMPAAGDLFVAVAGEGALGNGRPLRVSSTASLNEALISHGGLAQFVEGECFEFLRELADRAYTQRGFADFDGYRQVLLGRADAMIDPAVQPWDLCAPAVLIREAGGRFTGFDGSESHRMGGAIASNGHLHRALLEVSSRFVSA